MELTIAGVGFLLVGAYLFSRGPSALFAGLLFGAAFPATAVLIVPRYEFGVQPWHFFALLYWLRVGMDWAAGLRRRGAILTRASRGRRRNATVPLVAFTLAWCSASTLGYLLGWGEGIPLPAWAETSSLLQSVEMLDPSKRLFHLAYLYLMVGIAWAAFIETQRCGAGQPASAILQRLLRPWVWGALAAAAWGFLQVTAQHFGLPYPLVFNNNPAFLQVYAERAGPLTQMSGTFPEPSMFGLYMVGTAFLSLQWPGIVVPVFLMLAGTWSLSTTAMIGMLLGITGTLLVAATRPACGGWARPAILPLGLTLLVAVVGAALVGGLVWSGALQLNQQWLQGAALAMYHQTAGKMLTRSGQVRYEAFLNGIRLWLERPWFGWGVGTWRTVDMVSNTLANLGLVGMGLMSALVLVAAWKGWSDGAPWVSLALLLFFALHGLAVPEINFPYVWLLVGAILGTGSGSPRLLSAKGVSHSDSQASSR